MSVFKENKYKKLSYSQCGEDIIIEFIFSNLGIKYPSYIDIGAHHPFYISNTALFYKKGCRGVCVEPDPYLFKEIMAVRKKDICLNIGIGFNQASEADFYIMSTPTLNTFSKEQALAYKNYKIKEKVQIKLKTIDSIIDEYCEKTPNFISLDVEGLDYLILKAFNFTKYRPEVFCLETLTFTENNLEVKITSIMELLLSNGYMIYADTYINTIFVDKSVWENRK
jgi:FkbM family methyltransferase